MNVTVLFFGATADSVGKRRVALSLRDRTSAESVFAQIIEEFPQLKHHKLLFAVNQEYANGNETIREGDELAVFTAVSGG